MKNKDSKRLVVVGVFVLIGLVIMTAAIFMLGGKESKFAKNVTVNTVFDNIEGLKPGNNVWLSGMKIGTVKNIHFIEGNKIQLILKIEEEFRLYVKKDCIAKIGTDGLIGNKIVVIEGGTAESRSIDENDYLETASSQDMVAMMNMLKQNGENLVRITENLISITDDINNEKGLIGLLVKNPGFAQDVRTVMSTSKKTMDNIYEGTQSLQRFSHQLSNSHSSLNRLVNDTSMYYKLHHSIDNIESMSNDLSAAAGSLRITADKLTSERNAIGVLINKEENGEKVQRVIDNIESSSEKIKTAADALEYTPVLKKGIKRLERNED